MHITKIKKQIHKKKTIYPNPLGIEFWRIQLYKNENKIKI